MDFVPTEGRTDDFRLPEACPAVLRGSRQTKKFTHLGVLCDSVVNMLLGDIVDFKE